MNPELERLLREYLRARALEAREGHRLVEIHAEIDQLRICVESLREEVANNHAEVSGRITGVGMRLSRHYREDATESLSPPATPAALVKSQDTGMHQIVDLEKALFRAEQANKLTEQQLQVTKAELETKKESERYWTRRVIAYVVGAASAVILALASAMAATWKK